MLSALHIGVKSAYEIFEEENPDYYGNLPEE